MFTRLEKYSIDILPLSLIQHLDTFKYKFNPSFVKCGKMNYLAIRVCKSLESGIEAIIYQWETADKFRILNLTDYCEGLFKTGKVADPKVFKIGEDVYCTFNTGYVSIGLNKLFLAFINDFDNLLIKECVFSDRQKIEKNWAFFMKDNSLYSIYNVNPLVILKQTSSREDAEIIFQTCYNSNVNLPNLSIGTQLTLLNDDEYLLIAHKKIHVKSKRIYFGVPLIFNKIDFTLSISSANYLIHSYKSLWGNKFKFNKNLWSCTYFSGIHAEKDDFYISYGVNDLHSRIVKIKKDKLL